MELRVVSTDDELPELCAAILAEVATPDQPWSVTAAAAGGAEPDLYVWDFPSDVSPPEHVTWTYSNLIVVAHRRDVAEVQKCFGFEPHVVLKPANRVTLSALIGLAVSSRAAVSLRDDRDRMFQCLIEANLKLQQYDRDRTNFLTRVVHDLRTPLTVLNGYCGFLLCDSLGSLNENQREVIRRMQYSANRLSRMVSAVLELGMDRALRKGPNLQKADLPKSLSQVLQEIAYLAKEKDLRIDSQMEPCAEGLYFDPEQLEQVFANILDNACKFAPRSGFIQIRGGPYFWERRVHPPPSGPVPKERRFSDLKAPNSYRVDILDSGSPIPSEHLEIIFEEYASYAGGRDRSGVGLGLAICRAILDQHRGRIWAENTDKGPMFSFVLPAHVHKRIGPQTVASYPANVNLEAQP
jgi:signal transduction histidine kinase